MYGSTAKRQATIFDGEYLRELLTQYDLMISIFQGVGFAADLVVCVALGIDMFDCVFPTRTAVSAPNILIRNIERKKKCENEQNKLNIDELCCNLGPFRMLGCYVNPFLSFART